MVFDCICFFSNSQVSRYVYRKSSICSTVVSISHSGPLLTRKVSRAPRVSPPTTSFGIARYPLDDLNIITRMIYHLSLSIAKRVSKNLKRGVPVRLVWYECERVAHVYLFPRYLPSHYQTREMFCCRCNAHARRSRKRCVSMSRDV